MESYNDTQTLQEGLSQYLRRYNLGDGGYDDQYFKINFFWKFTLTLPNIENRVSAVKFHDLHHVLTEYPTGLRGEAEIGAWEIASGCGKYYSAWMLNIGSFFIGLLFFPVSLFRAFVWGRHCRNLYHNIHYDQLLLEKTIRDMRISLLITDRSVATNARDLMMFVLWVVITLTLYLFPFYLLYILLMK